MRGAAVVVVVIADVVRGKVADGILVGVAVLVVIGREVRGKKRGIILVVDAMMSVYFQLWLSPGHKTWCDEAEVDGK